MTRSTEQSALRYPLTGILGSVANVRTLRELLRHGRELSAPSLVARTKLAKASVRQALAALEATTIVEVLGSERTRLFRVRRDHPLASALDALFRTEEERFDAVLAAIRAAAQRQDGIVAVWLYGSVARGEDRATSDVDIAVVAESGKLSQIEGNLREALQAAEDTLAFRASVVTVAVDDLLRLGDEKDPWWTAIAQHALRIVGDSPDLLLERLRRRRAAEQRRAS